MSSTYHTIEEVAAAGRELLQDKHSSDLHRDFEIWDHHTADWLDDNFQGSGLSAQWSSIGTSNLVVAGGYSDNEYEYENFKQVVQARLRWLASIPKAIRSIGREQEKEKKISESASTKVFIVHGRDEEIKQTVARFVQQVDLDPIILHEQANKGKTIVEKFVDYSDVGFAIVLITPDDVGKFKDEEDLKPRARQNVILELGYFLGALGRNRVCAIYKEDVDFPSDYDGVVLIAYDENEGWKLKLAKELLAAQIQLNTESLIK